MEAIKSILKRAGSFFQGKEKKKLILPAALAAGVIVIGIIGALLLNRVEYTVLYSSLSAQEAGTLMNLLKEMGVEAKAKGTDTILVPEKQADELRIELASQGYPDTGLNYELFSNSSSIGSTDLERQTYLQYQLQENMRTTISRMSKVKDCIVIVNLATSSSFVLSNNTSEASVAVLLSLERGQTLTDAEARTIGAFVLKCVPKLKIENISIVDSDMHYYDIVSQEGTAETVVYSETQQQMTEQMKEILTQQALRVLEPAMGEGNVAVSVNLSLDFDRKTVSSVEFSPPVEGETQGMLISSEELYEFMNGGGGAAGQAGTDSNGVSAPGYVSGGNGNQASSYSKLYNYELNEIRTQIEKAQGTVQDLSVAVLVNNKIEGVDDYVGTIRNLVAKAIGVDLDYISVELMPFVQKAGDLSFDDYFQQNQQAMEQLTRMKLVRTVVIAAAILLAVLLAVKILRGKKAAPEENTGIHGEGAERYNAAGLPDMEQDAVSKEEQERMLQEIMNKKSPETEKVEELMERYPEAAVQILRSWIMEDR